MIVNREHPPIPAGVLLTVRPIQIYPKLIKHEIQTYIQYTHCPYQTRMLKGE